jgi:hypothetical protein
MNAKKTEPVWDGKYDEYGNRRPVDIAGSAMQKIEAVDMPEAWPWPGVAEECHSRIMVCSASFFG